MAGPRMHTMVPINQWALTGHIDATTGALVGYSAIARKP